MKASEIMTRDVLTVGPRTPVREAARLLATHSVTSAPVVDEDEELIGIVSEADLIRDRMPRDPRSHLAPAPDGRSDPAQLVGEVMTSVVQCLGGNADTADVAALMMDSDVRAVPIVDGGRLLGIVSRRDLLRTLLRDDSDIAAEIAERLDELVASLDRCVSVHDGVVTIRATFCGDHQRDAVRRLAATVPGVCRVHLRER
jgi:CBS domain-containing protein